MKKAIIMLLAGVLVFGVTGTGFASDWDKAGKALTVIEGLRLVTGGRVDVIGTIAGLNRGDGQNQQQYVYAQPNVRSVVHGRGNHYGHYKNKNKYATHQRYYRAQRVWVPHYVWENEYVPAHSEYRNGCRVYVPGYYIRVQVEYGGHWETK